MGFFKKIGSAFKKVTKKISFKNLVKVGGMLDPTGLVSGIQNAHYEKKAQEEQQRDYNEQKKIALANLNQSKPFNVSYNSPQNNQSLQLSTTEKLKNWLKKYWYIPTGSIAILIGAFLYFKKTKKTR